MPFLSLRNEAAYQLGVSVSVFMIHSEAVAGLFKNLHSSSDAEEKSTRHLLSSTSSPAVAFNKDGDGV